MKLKIAVNDFVLQVLYFIENGHFLQENFACKKFIKSENTEKQEMPRKSPK